MPTRRTTPRYEVLGRDLIAAIKSGRYPVGSYLPTEWALAQDRGLSRQTVRQAISRLVDQGLVSRHPGVGTRVLSLGQPTLYSHSFRSMGDLAHYATELHLNVDTINSIRVKGELARRLACRDGTEWHHLTGRRFREGDERPVAVSEIYLRAQYPGIEVSLRNGSEPIHVLLEREFGETVEEIRQDIRAGTVKETDAAALSVVAGSPALEIVRRYFCAGERMVLIGRVVHPAEQFTLSTSFRREADR